jgi:ethanolamine-phosphate cytidylyltransferase
MNREYLDYVIETYNVDYVVHGEDPCYVDGKDVYETAKQAGKFRTIPRTEGVSTTDIVGRMLLMTKEHHHLDVADGSSSTSASGGSGAMTAAAGHKSSDASSFQVLLGQEKSKFLTTSRMLQLFSAGVKAPTRGMRVVYIDGAWDLFHPGHVSILKAAREVR